MGDYDVVKAVLGKIADMTWMQIAMKPAKPFAFGRLDGTPIFGLPGNPVSSMVSFELLARPALRRMMGHTRLTRTSIVAVADAALQRASSEIDAELAALDAERATRRAELDETTLARYGRIRNSSGVAVARLVGHRCEGCHLDLSAAEVDDVKDEAASSDGVAECPNCGRMLVL